MDKYERIKIDINILSPKSVMGIFNFIDNCFENTLDFKYFKKHIIEFNKQEQFFVCYYLKKYISNDENSYLNKYIKSINDDYLTFDNSSHINNTVKLIYENVDKISHHINLNIETLKRQTKLMYKSSKQLQFIDKPYNYRIPLFFTTSKYPTIKDSFINKNDFKKQVEIILDGIIPKNQFESFFNNSFLYSGNISDLQLLNIEIKNSKDVYSSFHEMYSIYSKARNHYAKNIKDSFDKSKKDKIKEINSSNVSSTRKSNLIALLPKIPTIEIVRLVDVMKVMYNTFPQIRESSSKYLQKNSTSTLEKYLLTQSRNIK